MMEVLFGEAKEFTRRLYSCSTGVAKKTAWSGFVNVHEVAHGPRQWLTLYRIPQSGLSTWRVRQDWGRRELGTECRLCPTHGALPRLSAGSSSIYYRLSTRLLCRLRRVTPINFIHDLLCPADRIGNGAAFVLRQLACREDAGGDQQHALASSIDAVPNLDGSRTSRPGCREVPDGSLAHSFFVRL